MTDPLPNSAKKSPSRPRAFRRRIFILLGVLVVLIIIALVGAQTGGDPCILYGKIGTNLEKTENEFSGGVPGGWKILRKICHKSVAKNEARIEPEFEGDVENLDIKVTNLTDQHYFVPYKTKKELASFAQWATTEGQGKDKVSLCVKNKAKGTTTRIADGGYSADVVGCGLACTVTKIRGQRCAAKAGVTDWEVITQKYWIDGSPFDWDGNELEASHDGNRYNRENQLWKSKNNNNRTVCGKNDHYVGQYAYGPLKNGQYWGRYKCEKGSKWNCLWRGCNYWWTLQTGNLPASSARVYQAKKTAGGEDGYYTKCPERYYTFSGSYKAQCYYELSAKDQINLENPLLGTAYAAKIPATPDEDFYNCQKPCSNYNHWGSTPRTTPTGCTASGYSQTRIGTCYQSCAARGTGGCSGDSNCQTKDDGTTRYQYSEGCTYNWSAGSWYGCFSNGYQSRSVTCLADKNNQRVPHSSCDSTTQPANRKACTAYTWKLENDWSACDAGCIDFEYLRKTRSPVAFWQLPTAHAVAEDGKRRYKVTGNEYRHYYCQKGYNGNFSPVADSFCPSPKPAPASQQCSIECCI